MAARVSSSRWGASKYTRVRVREEAGERRKEAIAAVAVEAGVPKRVVFDAVVAAKNATP
jgi:16S rRNA (cytidine1402-2'-O)-methyltransferase